MKIENTLNLDQIYTGEHFLNAFFTLHTEDSDNRNLHNTDNKKFRPSSGATLLERTVQHTKHLAFISTVTNSSTIVLSRANGAQSQRLLGEIVSRIELLSEPCVSHVDLQGMCNARRVENNTNILHI